MRSRIKYSYLRPILMLIACFCINIYAMAQEEEYTIEPDPLPDSVVIQEIEPIDVDEYDYDVPDTKVYFMERRLQLSGGGPDSLKFRQVQDSIITNLKNDDVFWYVDYPFEKEKVEIKLSEERRSFWDHPAVQTILWIVIVLGFVAFLAIYLSNSNVGIFRRADKALQQESSIDEIPEDIFQIEYEREISKAIQSSDYRLATRLLFLRLLKDLSKRGIIKYQQDKTNFDYILQLHGTQYYNDFFRLTRNYEYSWYGQFQVEKAEFDLIRKDFEKFENTLGKR